MSSSHNPASLASLLKCLSILETETYRLYKVLSDRTEPPLAKSLLFSVAIDSQKHAELLKGIANSIDPKHEAKLKDCEKRIGETLNHTTALTKEIAAKKKISEPELQQLIAKLDELESVCGEEYSVFVQLKTLELLSQEVNRLYKVDLDSLKSIFTSIINDEEHHREIVETIKTFLHERRQEQLKADPLAEYRELLNQ